jgi:lysozyme
MVQTKADPKTLKPSKTAENLATEFEADGPVPLTAYDDPLKPGLWTIGYGHTGPDVTPGLTITRETALIFLQRDLTNASRCVSRLIDVPLTQNEYDALVDFVFNLGCGTFYTSTMRKLINNGEIQSAALEFEKWDHASGKVVAGLLRRRQAEEKIFNDV